MPGFVVQAYYDFVSCLDRDAMPLFLGWMDGQPVATSQLLPATGVAGIFSVGTVPGARRQGIGTAMTLAPLLQAREMGYEIAILHASEMGAGIYRSLGFKSYCQINHYVWSPKRE
jgi:predicted acetyltransferase